MKSNIISKSKKWICKNNEYSNLNRHEGNLNHNKFNKSVLDYIKEYQTEFKKIKNIYFVGIEFEFYIYKPYIDSFIKDLLEIIPKEKMVIEDIFNVLESDSRQFFLIGDRTGKPPMDYTSLELVTPKIDFRFFPYYLNSILNLLNKYKIKTDNNIGLHIHFSTMHIKQISPISLLYFLEKNNVFNWENREFVRSITSQVFDYSQNDWEYIYEKIIRKCYDINFFNFNENNRIEYRSIGGKNYTFEHRKIIENFFSVLKSYDYAISTSDDKIIKELKNKCSSVLGIVDIKKLSTSEILELDVNDLWVDNK